MKTMQMLSLFSLSQTHYWKEMQGDLIEMKSGCLIFSVVFGHLQAKMVIGVQMTSIGLFQMQLSFLHKSDTNSFYFFIFSIMYAPNKVFKRTLRIDFKAVLHTTQLRILPQVTFFR